MSRGAAVAGGRAVAVLGRVGLRRLLRSRTLWVTAIIAAGPPLVTALLISGHSKHAWSDAFNLVRTLLVVALPLFVSSAISEEIEDRTFTYLWSRPIPRWSMVFGKLAAGTPVAFVLLAACAVATAAASGDPSAQIGQALVALAIGVVAVGMASAGMASLAPHLAQRLTYAYLFMFDLLVGELPLSLQNLSMTYHVKQLAGLGETTSNLAGNTIGCLAIGGFWLALGLVRLGRAEYATDR
jgi:ABC-type transport system involved in multi-copper enzyme maturation permease subunit